MTMVPVRALFLLTMLLVVSACAKDESCTVCDYYTGLSQQVIPQPGSNLGLYFTATKTYLLQESGDGYEVAGWSFKPDAEGRFRDEPDAAGAAAKGYELLEVAIRNDSLFFEVRKQGGFSEIFAGGRI